MKRLHVSTALLAAVLGLATLVPKANAGDWDKKTVVTISEPMAVPGATLLPGTYVFRLVDVPGERMVVTIQNKRMNETFATMLAVPNTRIEPTDNTVFKLNEAPGGRPEALHAWFYPGEVSGYEFVYPNEK